MVIDMFLIWVNICWSGVIVRLFCVYGLILVYSRWLFILSCILICLLIFRYWIILVCKILWMLVLDGWVSVSEMFDVWMWICVVLFVGCLSWLIYSNWFFSVRVVIVYCGCCVVMVVLRIVFCCFVGSQGCIMLLF